MFKESSSELDDSYYRCPKCPRTFTAIQNLRDHLDIVHLHKPTRDTDEENFSDTLYRRAGRLKTPASRSPSRHALSKDALEIERQLHRAKELELRHKIFHRHTKSQDELRLLNEEIHSAKQRQYEMCDVIHGARGQIESLRETAEKVTADQHALINRLKDELHTKDSQLEKSTADLRRLAEMRLKQQLDIEEVVEEKEKHRAALRDLGTEIEAREEQIEERQKEVATLKEFINSATQKEIKAREKLEEFINSLLDRAEEAEAKLHSLRHYMAANGFVPQEARRAPGSDHYRGSSNIANGPRPLSAEALVNAAYTKPQLVNQYSPSLAAPHPIQQQQQQQQQQHPASQPWQPASPPSKAGLPPHTFVPQRRPQPNQSDFPPRKKLPAGPFYPSHDPAMFPALVSENARPGPEYMPGTDKRKPKLDPVERWRGAGRDDRPESGYSSLQHGHSRPHSQLSSVSETSNFSIDTVVPVYEQEMLRDQGIVFSDDPDISSDLSDSEVPHDLKVDDDGILWDRDSDAIFDSVSLPSKHNSLTRTKPKLSGKSRSTPHHKVYRTPSKLSSVPSPLNLSRLSSINSTDKEILSGINRDTKFELQRYKFLLRDKLRMLKEQEKLFRKDGRLSSEVTSDSDLTSVTDDESLTSLSVSSGSEFEVDSVPRKKLVYDSGVKAEKRSDLNGPMSEGKLPDQIRRQSQLASKAPPIDVHTQQRRGVLFLIFMYLDTTTRSQVALVCREWRDVSRHPTLWRKVVLAKGRMTSKYLQTISDWCTELQTLTLEEIRARPKKSFESFEEYKKNTRGSLEEGMEVLLQAAHNTLTSLTVVDCGNILTDRCLWLASCSCRLLARVAYISDTDPVGPEVMWSLGAGCREITTLITPPLYPKKKSFRRNIVERAERFNNRCVQMISWCWPDLQVLSVGGKHINIKGLVSVARNCSVLTVLELHRLTELNEQMSVTMCHAGLRHLEALEINYTAVTPGAVKHFAKSCANLKTLKVRVGMADYFSEDKKTDNRKSYDKIVKQLQDLKKTSSIAKILTIQTDTK